MALEQTIEKFSGVLKSIEMNVLKQASFAESLYNEKPLENLEQQKQTSLLQRLVGIQSEELKVLKEGRKRARGEERLTDIPNKTRPTDESGKPVTFGGAVGADVIGDAIVGVLGAISLGGILKTAALAIAAPFAYKFVEGFFGEFGLNGIEAAGVTLGGLIALKTTKSLIKDVLAKDTTKKFMRGFLGKAGIATGIGIIGSLIGNAVGDAFENPELGDDISQVANIAALGSFFGIKGLIIGAVAGLALTLGQKLLDWFNNQDKKYRDKLDEKLAANMAEADKAFEEGDYETASKLSAENLARTDQELKNNEQRLGVEARESVKRAKEEALTKLEDLAKEGKARPADIQLAATKRLEASDKTVEDYENYIKLMSQAFKQREPEVNMYDIVKTVRVPVGLGAKPQNIEKARQNVLTEISTKQEMTYGTPLQIPSTGMFWWKKQNMEELMPPLAQKTEALSQGSTAMAAAGSPVVIKGGDRVTGGSTYNDNKTITQVTNIIDPTQALNFNAAQAR